MSEKFALSRDGFSNLLDWFELLTAQVFLTPQQEELYKYFRYLRPDEAKGYLEALVMTHPRKTYTIADLYMPIAGVISRVKDDTWKTEFEKRRSEKRQCGWCDSTGVLEAIEVQKGDTRHLSVILAIDSPKTTIFKCGACDIAKDFRKLGPSIPWWDSKIYRPKLTPIHFDNWKSSTVDQFVTWKKGTYRCKRTNEVLERRAEC